MASSSSHTNWGSLIATVVELTAAGLFLLQFFGITRYLRGRLWPRIREVGGYRPSPRLLSVGRTLMLTGLTVIVALGFASALWVRAVLAGALGAVVFAKELNDWRADLAALRQDAAPQAPLPQRSVELAQPMPQAPPALEPVSGPAEAKEAKKDDEVEDVPARPAKRSRVVVMKDSVELSVIAGSGLMPVNSVSCEVTPPSGTTYRAIVPPSPPPRGLASVLGALGPRWAVLQYPVEFDHAPRELPKGVYRVRWEVPPSAALGLFGSTIHDAFRI